jgi:hypothetical protein
MDKWCPGAESNHRHEDFQSSALPTELPGQGMRKRVLNSRERSESSPERPFRAPVAIIPGWRRAGFVEGDVGVPGIDAEMFEVSDDLRSFTADSQTSRFSSELV